MMPGCNFALAGGNAAGDAALRATGGERDKLHGATLVIAATSVERRRPQTPVACSRAFGLLVSFARGGRAMEGADRRQRRRMPLRLRVVRIERLAGGCQVVADAWTTNVSAGGMYVMLSGRDVPTRGAEVAFELAVPAGEGYSSSEGRIRGTGTVVRSDPAGAESPGVAVAFVRPLALDF